MSKKRIVVVCPGRGSYTAETLGYLKSENSDFKSFVEQIDSLRSQEGLPTLSEMDRAEKFKVSLHTKGEHASPLIYACAYKDFLAINPEQFEVVAVTGNSMGWYLTMAMAGSLNPQSAFKIIQTMGSMMKDGTVGGQIIYPVVDDNWNYSHELHNHITQVCEKLNQRKTIEIHASIYLGGYLVIGANKEGIKELLKELDPRDPYPFQLVNHGAFHTPLCNEISDKAFKVLGEDLFSAPKIPMIDGRGQIWKPYSTDLSKLREYTLGHQVIAPYDFSTSIKVAIKEFAPDHLVLLGPGNSLGGAIGQVLIQNKWLDVSNKSDFVSLQKEDPFLISMGMPEQRALVE